MATVRYEIKKKRRNVRQLRESEVDRRKLQNDFQTPSNGVLGVFIAIFAPAALSEHFLNFRLQNAPRYLKSESQMQS